MPVVTWHCYEAVGMNWKSISQAKPHSEIMTEPFNWKQGDMLNNSFVETCGYTP